MAKETWTQISKRKLSVYPKCKICKMRDATQFHHGIEWRMKKHRNVLDVEENGIEICQVCHAVAQNYDTALLVWEINLERYGAEKMSNFVFNLQKVMKTVPAWLIEKAKECVE